MSDTRSPILEFSDNNPIPVYVAPVPDTSANHLLKEDGGALLCEDGSYLTLDISDTR